MTKKLYIAGPMAGLPKFNYPAFFKAAERLQELGYETINPAAECECRPAEPEYKDFALCGIKRLLEADGVATLNGWVNSKGANAEVALAQYLEMEVAPIGVWCRMALDDNKSD